MSNKNVRLLRKLQVIAGSAATSAFVTLAMVGCGDVFADPDGEIIEPPEASADVEIDTNNAAVFPDDTPPTCPSSRPRENTSCEQTGSTCEFGESADSQCNAMLTCRGAPLQGYWEAQSSETCHRAVCPRGANVASLDNTPCTIDGVDGGATDRDEAVCNMIDGVCACTTGRDGASRHERKWVCIRPISSCPTNRPRAGDTCSGRLWCDYGSCAFKRGLLMECRSNVWLAGGAPCQ